MTGKASSKAGPRDGSNEASGEGSDVAMVAGRGVRRSSRALGVHYQSLDGIRAVGMIAIFAGHSDARLVRGTYMAISLFFTLSGFLIVSILLRRRDQPGPMSLRSFWSDRYRRLIPAAMLTLFGIVIFGATVADPAQAKEIPGQVAAAAAQVVNWFFIYIDKSYIQLFAAPSPVQHFWSLSVEEQFYIFMPIVFWAIVRYTKTLKPIAAFFGLGALASTAWMIWLYNHGASLDRLYYGTDTRAAEILMGGLLAVVLHRFPLRRLGESGKRIMSVVGIVAFGVTIWIWTNFELADGPVWRGGFLLVALVSCALVASLVSGGPLALVLSWGFLPAMGRLTYGLYLYQWPIFLWLTPDRTGLDGLPLLALQLVVIFAAAIASYHLVEMPIRKGIPDWPKGPMRWAVAPTVAVAVVALAFIAGNREVHQELTPLATPVSKIAPITPGDGVLNVLVIPDASTAKVTAALADRAASSDSLDVTVAQPFACRGLVPLDGRETCSNWIDEWPQLIATVNPDVVLFYVGGWDRAQVEQLSGLRVADDPFAASAWTESVLQAGLDLLTTEGASVVAARLPPTLDEAIAGTYDPFSLAMADLPKTNQDFRQILDLEFPTGIDVTSDEFSTPAVDVLVPSLTLYARTDGSDAPRVLVVGDSVARTIGYGLERWGASTGQAVVWTTATIGCGLADEGTIIAGFGAGKETPITGPCAEVRHGWQSQIEQFDPDLVIVLSTVWDLQERRLADWTEPLEPGDPAFDDYILREYRESVDELSANGAAVLWLKGPCARSLEINGVPGESTGAFATDRVRHLDDVLIPRLVSDRPQVKTFDLFPILCPDGEFVEELDGVGEVRPDGIHFSTAGSLWLADNFGESLIRLLDYPDRARWWPDG